MNAVAVKIARPPFGEALNRLRIKRGLSHHDVATKCGVSVTRIRSWIDGDEVPSPGEFTRLRNVCFHELAPYREDLKVRWRDLSMTDVAENQLTVAAEEALGNDLDAAMRSAVPRPEDAETFGEALRIARVMEGMSQSELGELVEVTGQAVSAWENGHVEPVLEHVQKLLVLLPVLQQCAASKSRNIAPPSGGPGITRNAGTSHAIGETSFALPALSRGTGEPTTVRGTLGHTLTIPRPPVEDDSPHTLAVAGEAYAEALVELERAKADHEAAHAALLVARANEAKAAEAVGRADAYAVEARALLGRIAAVVARR